MSITIIIIRNRKQELKLKRISQTLGRDASRVQADEGEEPSRRDLSYLGKHKALQRKDTETLDNAKRKLTQSPYVPLTIERSRSRRQMVTWSAKAQRAEDAVTMPESREKEGRTHPPAEAVGWPQGSGTS